MQIEMQNCVNSGPICFFLFDKVPVYSLLMADPTEPTTYV